jgi:hypothetical protein
MIRKLLLAGLIAALLGCSPKNDFIAGGLYTIDNGDGSFGIAKILALDDELIHVKVYKNKWTNRPSSVDLSSLSMGSISDKDGFGIGHLPLGRKTFLNWKPVLVAQQPISEDELDGYNEWKKDQGGHF